MQSVSEFWVPIATGVVMLLIPVCTGFIVRAITKKLDEGRVRADERAAETEKLLLAYQKENDRVGAERHRDNITRFDRIEIQTTNTNGKVAQHDRQITALEAQNELLIRLFPGPAQPEKPHHE